MFLARTILFRKLNVNLIKLILLFPYLLWITPRRTPMRIKRNALSALMLIDFLLTPLSLVRITSLMFWTPSWWSLIIQPLIIQNIIKNVKKRKAPGYDKISNTALKNFPPNCVIYTTKLSNSIFKFCFYFAIIQSHRKLTLSRLFLHLVPYWTS